MREVLKMSSQERERKAFFEMVKQGQLTIKQASVKSGLSYRQGRRVYQSYLKKGDAGLIHKSRDQQSNRKHPHRQAILALYREKYEGFAPKPPRYLWKEFKQKRTFLKSQYRGHF